MRRQSRAPRALKWAGTVLCAAILVGFVFSTRRAVSWDSPSLRYEINLLLGSIGYSWRPETWRREAERYPPNPGWGIARYGGSPKLSWSITRGANRSWNWLSIPLWIPFVVVAVPTGMLWYRDWSSVRQAIRRLAGWLRPKRRKKVTLWLVAAFCVLHVVGLFASCAATYTLYDFLLDYRPKNPVYAVGEWVLFILFWTTALWGVLWAWLFVRLRNRLFERQPGHHCPECGYDLTGNVSGRCPECGTLVPDAGAGRESV